MMADDSPLIEAMRNPGFYPGCPTWVELRQTHISYVFLAGEYVYKVKKPVRFTFLDYSTLAKRRHFCLEEVRLNRRLAPAVYLAVLPIITSKGAFSLGTGGEQPEPPEVVEYALKMRRLPDDRMLDALVRNEKIGVEEIDAIAQRLVSFHSRAASDRAAIYGTLEGIWRRLADNFRETERFVGKTIPKQRFKIIEERSRSFMTNHRRVANYRVREGHGDLRAEHICLDDGIAIFDCIEFDERLRYCDVASEVGFLSMDLDFLGAPSLSERFLATYAGLAEDLEMLTLLPFYQCYRAYVRGKVESLKSQEPEVPIGERNKAERQAARYFRLSHRYARGSPPPALVVVCGLIGTGKSTVTRTLEDLTGFVQFNSDITRKGLARVAKTFRVVGAYRTGLYNDSMTRRTNSTLWANTETSLKEGKGVIVDATFKDPEHRRILMEGAARLDVPILFVECKAREKEILKRLRERATHPDEVSDATSEIYLHQRDEFSPLNEVPDRCHLEVDTEADLDSEIGKVEEWLYRRSRIRNL